MSKKKDKSFSPKDMEEEISRVCGEGNGTGSGSIDTPSKDTQDVGSLLTEIMRQQALHHNQLIQSLSDSSQHSSKAVVSAVKEALNTNPTCTPQVSKANTLDSLLLPPETRGLGCEEDDDYSSVEDFEFEGWDIPPSGTSAVHTATDLGLSVEKSNVQDSQATEPAKASTSTDTAQATSPTASQLDEGLFLDYDSVPNWKPAPAVMAWLKEVRSREVPPQVLKEVNDNMVPQVELQPLFTPPDLPQAISDRLKNAPQSISKVPKMVNDHLLRAQRELAVAYKPFIELLSFYFSSQFKTLKEFIPEISHILESHKMLLSQSLALVVSSGIKISKARKDALRPIFKSEAAAVLRHNPTAAQVLGSEDLAKLSEDASREKKAFSGVFRPTYFSRARYKQGRGSFQFRGLQYQYNQYQNK